MLKERACVRVHPVTFYLVLKTQMAVLRMFVFPSYWQNCMYIDATWPAALCLFFSVAEGTKPSPLHINSPFSGSASVGYTQMHVAVLSPPRVTAPYLAAAEGNTRYWATAPSWVQHLSDICPHLPGSSAGFLGRRKVELWVQSVSSPLAGSPVLVAAQEQVEELWQLGLEFGPGTQLGPWHKWCCRSPRAVLLAWSSFDHPSLLWKAALYLPSLITSLLGLHPFLLCPSYLQSFEKRFCWKPFYENPGRKYQLDIPYILCCWLL